MTARTFEEWMDWTFPDAWTKHGDPVVETLRACWAASREAATEKAAGICEVFEIDAPRLAVDRRKALLRASETIRAFAKEER